MHVDISGVSGGGVLGKGAQHGKIQIELHVQILEVKIIILKEAPMPLP